MKSGAEGWSRSRPRSLAALFGLQLCLAFIGPDCLARFGGDQHIGRFNADADQLDWLISITAMIVLFWSRATRDLLKACPGVGRGRSAGASRHSIGYMQRRSCHVLVARPLGPPAAGGDGIRTHEFDQGSVFQEYRNRIGGLLLLPKSFNAAYGDLPYAEKREHYVVGQNLLARSLHERAYDHNPGFRRFIEESGLPFRAHAEFRKADLDERVELYRKLAKQIWDPGRLSLEAAS